MTPPRNSNAVRDIANVLHPYTDAKAHQVNGPLVISRGKGVRIFDEQGKEYIEAMAGLWCTSLGFDNERLVQAAAMTPIAVDLETVIHRAAEFAALVDGLIGRERGYHGVGFGGMSVGGIGPNRKQFGALLPYVDHLPHTHLPAKNSYCRGEPPHGAELADVLENLVALHGAETIAAVMVEPVAGSTGVLVPPVGYLKRLRDICTKHGILLIFDEVITGFGRLGANFGAERLGVVPDIMTMAKGLTNAAVPMGAVAVKNEIYDAIVTGTSAGIEFFHGYTYSGHPLAAAAAIATLELHRAEDLPGRALALEPYWQDAVHSLKGLPNVIDIRDVGLIGAVELAPRPGKPTQRALDVFRRCFDDGVLIRVTADIIAMSPPLICEKPHVDRLINTLAEALVAEAA